MLSPCLSPRLFSILLVNPRQYLLVKLHFRISLYMFEEDLYLESVLALLISYKMAVQCSMEFYPLL